MEILSNMKSVKKLLKTSRSKFHTLETARTTSREKHIVTFI